jgi:phosphoserine phosphatase
MVRPHRLVVFDLDGTLLCGPTVCQVLAEPLGRSEALRRLEALCGETQIAAAPQEMAVWYRHYERGPLQVMLKAASWAPGAVEGVALLQKAGCAIGIASVTWSFAVAWFAEQLGVEQYLGTRLLPGGAVEQVWGRDKGPWLRLLADQLAVGPDRLAAVGDSPGDESLLRAASVRIFVGPTNPPLLPGLIHLPNTDLRIVARRVLSEWTA